MSTRKSLFELINVTDLCQDQLELHRPGGRFAKLELSGRSKPTV